MICWIVPILIVITVVSGDTYYLKIGIWLSPTSSHTRQMIELTETVRLLGVRTWPMTAPTEMRGRAARRAATEWFRSHPESQLSACRRDQDGAVLGLVDDLASGSSLIRTLREGGHLMPLPRSEKTMPSAPSPAASSTTLSGASPAPSAPSTNARTPPTPDGSWTSPSGNPSVSGADSWKPMLSGVQ